MGCHSGAYGLAEEAGGSVIDVNELAKLAFNTYWEEYSKTVPFPFNHGRWEDQEDGYKAVWEKTVSVLLTAVPKQVTEGE